MAVLRCDKVKAKSRCGAMVEGRAAQHQGGGGGGDALKMRQYLRAVCLVRAIFDGCCGSVDEMGCCEMFGGGGVEKLV